MSNCKAMRFKVFDFFCGCGGTSAGLRSAGMEIVGGLDIDSCALATFHLNFPEAKVTQGNIQKISVSSLSSLLKLKKNDVLVFAVCAPCQPFSMHNHFKNRGDARVHLLDEIHPFVKHYKPDYLLLENVPGLQRIEGGPLKSFLSLLDKLGYSYDKDILNAADFGVPQIRKRLVVIASKHGEIALPEGSYGEGKIPYKTVREAISCYHPLLEGEKSSQIPDHECARLSDINKKRISTLKEGQDRTFLDSSLELPCHKKLIGHSDVYGRLSWDKPAITMTTKCISFSNGRFGHPVQNRALSVREAASIQSFPESFIFHGTTWEKARQVGNAVPVLLAEALGKQIINHQRNLCKTKTTLSY